MDPETQTSDLMAQLAQTLGVFWTQVEAFLGSLMRPWNAYQIGIALALWAIAHLLKVIVEPRMTEWMRSREGWPKWRLRVLIVFRQRLRMIFFVALMWSVVWIMREATWPSRSYLLASVATLA